MSAGPSRSCAVSNSPSSRSSCFPQPHRRCIIFFNMFMSFVTGSFKPSGLFPPALHIRFIYQRTDF
ncbi:heat-stable enterotoxin ST-IA/ST-P domain protein [Escherichia coli O26:H11 str. 2011C-3274]|nr:heat-stable enterotoxin ST-IA/ST-P domain protein [Escherichia coli O26:H11 str. 2011C-3274]